MVTTARTQDRQAGSPAGGTAGNAADTKRTAGVTAVLVL